VVTIASVTNRQRPRGSLLPTDSTDPSGVIQALLALKPWPAPNLAKGTPPGPGLTPTLVPPP